MAKIIELDNNALAALKRFGSIDYNGTTLTMSGGSNLKDNLLFAEKTSKKYSGKNAEGQDEYTTETNLTCYVRVGTLKDGTEIVTNYQNF